MRRPLLVASAALLFVVPLPAGLASGVPSSGSESESESESQPEVGEAAPVAAFRPGAPGVGDPYFPLDGNGGYDVVSYDLAVRYNPADNVLVGLATIRANALQDLSRFNLDLDGMSVRSITVAGVPARWSRDGDELIITPAAGIPNHAGFATVVRYDGVPDTIGSPLIGVSGFMHTDDGAVVAGQPDVAATWYPVNDHPIDKASYTFRITVPAGVEAVANGIPRGRTSSGGWTTWTWQAVEPMASYLSTATIGQFDLDTRFVDGIRYVDAIDVDLIGTRTGNIAAAAFDRQPEIVEFLSGVFGPYPFSAAGGIVDDYGAFGFALENQTRPIYARGFFSDARFAESVVAHELAHQWYGDSVAVQAWQHIWLNEGFATYAQWLWSEEQGFETTAEIFADHYSTPAGSSFWDLTIGDPGPDDLFDGAVYDRGAMTLHALRETIGDADFFALLPAWAQQQETGNGTTTEFVALAEQISGQQLDALFDDWLFTPAKPPVP